VQVGVNSKTSEQERVQSTDLCSLW